MRVDCRPLLAGDGWPADRPQRVAGVVVVERKTKKIVFIAGNRSHASGEHEFRAGCMLLAKSLESSMGFKTVVYENGWPKDPKAFEGAQAGIAVNVVTKDAAAWRQAIGKREFELLPMQVRSSPAPSDPYQGWHSESDQPGGGNRSGFRNDEADDLIEEIRTTEDASRRNVLYMELQELIYEEQPVIFLYVPVERMIVNTAIEMTPSSRRPGYFENLFRPNKG